MISNMFNNIYDKFKLTDKFYNHVDFTCNYFEMNKEWQDLMHFCAFFCPTVDSGFYCWDAKISVYKTPTGRWEKYCCFMIHFCQESRVLSKINLWDIPKGKKEKDIALEVIKKEVGYFIAVMMSHGYVEKIKEISKDD